MEKALRMYTQEWIQGQWWAHAHELKAVSRFHWNILSQKVVFAKMPQLLITRSAWTMPSPAFAPALVQTLNLPHSSILPPTRAEHDVETKLSNGILNHEYCGWVRLLWLQCAVSIFLYEQKTCYIRAFSCKNTITSIGSFYPVNMGDYPCVNHPQ